MRSTPSPAAALAIVLLVSLRPGHGAPTPSKVGNSVGTTSAFSAAHQSLPYSAPARLIANTSSSVFPGTSKEAIKVTSVTTGGLRNNATFKSTHTFGTTPTFGVVPTLSPVQPTTSLSSSKSPIGTKFIVTGEFKPSDSFTPSSVLGLSLSSFYTTASISTSSSVHSISNLTSRSNNVESYEYPFSKSVIKLPNRVAVPRFISSSISPSEISSKSTTYGSQTFHNVPSIILTEIYITDPQSSDSTFDPILNTSFTAPFVTTSSTSSRSPATEGRRAHSRSTRSAATKAALEATPSEAPQSMEVVINAPRRRFSAIRSCSVGYTWIRGLCRRIFGATPTPTPHTN